VKSDVLNCQHSLSDLMSTSLAQRAALWQFYGHRSVIALDHSMMFASKMKH